MLSEDPGATLQRPQSQPALVPAERGQPGRATAARPRHLALRPETFVLLLALLAFAVRLYHLSYQSLWRDEADALRFATQDLSQFLAMFSRMGQNGPLFFLTLHYWLAVAGRSEFALRFLSACFGTLAVPVAYGLMRNLAGRRPAALFALFMVISPYLVWYGQEAKMYALLSLLVPLSLWLAVLGVQRGRWYYWVGLYLSTSLAVYNHILVPLVVPVQALWILLAPCDPRAARPVPAGNADGEDASQPPSQPALFCPSFGRRLLYAGIYLAALGLPYLPILRWAVPLWLNDYQTGFAFTPLPEMVSGLLAVWTRGILSAHWYTGIPVLLTVLAGSILWVMARGRGGWRLVVMLAAWLMLPAIEIYIISLSTPLYVDRYLIWALPAFLALAALGVTVLVHAWRPLGLLAAGIILAYNVADTSATWIQPLKSDFRSAARYVQTHRQPGDRLLFQISYNEYLFSYYYGEPLGEFADGPYTNDGQSEADLDQTMTVATAGAPAIWLIASEWWLWDQRNMTEAWLNAHSTVTDRADFTLVSVTRYQMAGP